ncbi:branched-chain amino acid ABC transporter permease [Acidiphilium sp. AL]|uniref:Branched-chain amino acid ABC transporter permease n=1 Tax=Acidiphilium iwatense TaxID=768198 RepID=A0ABS9DUP7_9PROT|nr:MULTISPECIES: branched-chain amino acid ABC transporter permease [Acidiphilium]MCF3946463.1 branched-chain amino acid ABC transporter permease [Acidiphilium iwatense]MCU4158633.1 branched-chain amino acid ABC transporter permease [Acidiphilium sp. AL]
MGTFIQQVINGLTVGGIYALIALGYTMVYGVLRLINFAHGDLCILGAFVGLTMLSGALGGGHPGPALVLLAFVVAVIAISVAGVALEFVAYRPLRKADRLAAVVSALGASMLIENGIMLIWGPEVRVFPSGLLPATTWHVAGASISFVEVMIIIVSVVLMAALYGFVNHTRFGTAIRAAAIDQDAARLMGINVNRVISSVFVIGPALGAVGGLFIGLYYREAYFTMGWTYGLNAFIAAIIGGIGNIPGAMLGGVLLGLFNAFAAGYVSSSWQNAITFALLIAILLIRPSGLLGERVAEKV